MYLQRAIREASSYRQCLTKVNTCLCLFFKILTDPDPAGEAHDAPPAPLIGWGGGNPLPIPHPPRRLRRLGLVAPANWGGECLHPSDGMEGPVSNQWKMWPYLSPFII